MLTREVLTRYRGSMLGLAWSFINPLAMLLVYTVVFAGIMKVRWSATGGGGKFDYALTIFVGLIVHGLVAECVNRAPALILSNVNYVKKVIFPLEILPLVALGSAMFHAFTSFLVLMLVQLAVNHMMPLTLFFFPMLLLPLMLMILGISWFLASLGAYLRDVSQVTAMLMTILLFLSPVFYSANVLGKYSILMKLNPLTYFIEESRNLLILGQMPHFAEWVVMMIVGLLVAWTGFVWFQKTRVGFADVV